MNDVLITSVQPERRQRRERADRRSVVACSSPRSTSDYKPQKADGSLDAGMHFKYDIKAQQGRLDRGLSTCVDCPRCRRSGGAGDMFLMVKGAKHGVIKGESRTTSTRTRSTS